MKDDLNAIKGILSALLLSLPFWVGVVLLLMYFGLLG
jgi:hypothetical protein